MLSSFLVALLPASVAFAAPLGNTTAPRPPPGGVDTNATSPAPVYAPIGPANGFDYQSLALALHQEWIELDLFNYGLERFSDAEFDAVGINAEQRYLLKFMANQEVGHATLLTNMLGANAPRRCVYNYTGAFDSVATYVDFNQRLTAWGESGVYGFLPHLDSRPAAQLLLESITTEARQQMIFRQFEGTFPMPYFFMAGLPQSWAWSLLSPWIQSCPAENQPLGWQIFPKLNLLNGPSAVDVAFQSTPYPDGGSAVSHNRTAISAPGRQLNFTWNAAGEIAQPYNQSTTSGSKVPANLSSTAPLWMVWVQQLNATFTPVTRTGSNSGFTLQPNGTVFTQSPRNDPEYNAILATDPIINGTSFVALVSSNPYVTPYNLSLLNDYVVAGPATYGAA